MLSVIMLVTWLLANVCYMSSVPINIMLKEAGYFIGDDEKKVESRRIQVSSVLSKSISLSRWRVCELLPLEEGSSLDNKIRYRHDREL